MRASVSVIVAWVCAIAQPAAQADKAFLSIMGFSCISSQRQIQAAIPGLNCTVPGQICMAPDRQLEGVRMAKVMFFLNRGTLQSVLMNFEHRAFRTLKKYLIQTYGKPTVTNAPSSSEPDLIWTGRAVDLYLDNARSEPTASLMFVVIGTGSPAERRRR